MMETKKRGRIKGTSKTGGRTRGTSNKVTKAIKEKCDKIVSLAMEDIMKELKKCSLKEKILIVTSLTKFVLPQGLHLQSENNHLVTITWNEEKTYEANNKTE